MPVPSASFIVALVGVLAVPTAWSFESASPSVLGHQGIASDASRYVLIDTAALRVYDRAWQLVAENTSALAGTDLNHLGDGDLFEGKLYVPVEHYRGCWDVADTSIAVYDAETLELREVAPLSGIREVAAAAVVPPSDPYGLGGTRGILYVVSFCGDDRIHRFDAVTFARLPPLRLDTWMPLMQGIDYASGSFFIQDLHGNVFSVDAVTVPGFVQHLFTDRHGGAGEGVDAEPGRLRIHRDEGAPREARVYTYRHDGTPPLPQAPRPLRDVISYDD